jgi:hypothetical protein
MKTLLTFTGFHDPFAAGGLNGDMRSGPVLTVVAGEGLMELFSFPRRKWRRLPLAFSKVFQQISKQRHRWVQRVEPESELLKSLQQRAFSGQL